MFKSGDIVFIMHSTSKLSRLIAWFMKSAFSHSALVSVESAHNKTLLTETSDFQVTLATLNRYIADPGVAIEIYRDTKLSIDERDKIGAVSFNQLGEWYGWLQLLSFAIRALVKRVTKRDIGNFIRQGRVCCAVVGYSYKEALPKHPLSQIDPECYDTEELRQFCIKNNYTLVYKKEV